MKVKLIKRVMELPYSTPSAAVQHEFGLIDLSLEVIMEKILFTVKVLKSDDQRKAKQLLLVMLAKKVPGFCTDVLESCTNVFGLELGELVKLEGDLRMLLKQKVVELQGQRLQKQMVSLSKTDRL